MSEIRHGVAGSHEILLRIGDSAQPRPDRTALSARRTDAPQ